MRKGIILLVAVVALGGIFYGITQLFSGGTSGSVCEQFINQIRKNDADNSYKLFTDDAKSTLTLDDWKAQTNEFYGAYYDKANPPLKFKEKKITVTGDSGEDETNETYVIANGSSRYLGTCYLVQTDKGRLLSGFRSQADFNPEDYSE